MTYIYPCLKQLRYQKKLQLTHSIVHSSMDCQLHLPKCFICCTIIECAVSIVALPCELVGLPVPPSCSINRRWGSHWNSTAAARPSINLPFSSFFNLSLNRLLNPRVHFSTGTFWQEIRRWGSSFKIGKALKWVNFSFTLRSLQSCCWLGTPLHRSSYIFLLQFQYFLHGSY